MVLNVRLQGLTLVVGLVAVRGVLSSSTLCRHIRNQHTSSSKGIEHNQSPQINGENENKAYGMQKRHMLGWG